MNKAILGVAVVLTSMACARSDPPSAPGMEYSKVHVLVDRAVILGTDPAAVIDPVWWTANIYAGFKEYEASLAAFSRSQRLLFAIMWYRSEVANGGHEQFYFNSTGIVWRDALAGFELLGLDEFSSALRESTARLGGQPAFDRQDRQDALDRLQPDFGDLDDRFYALEESMDLDSKMLAYMREHVEEFEFDGLVKKPTGVGE